MRYWTPLNLDIDEVVMRIWTLVCMGLVVLCAACSSARPPLKVKPGEKTFRVGTYNVNYGLAGDPGMLKVIAELDADVLCLQETTPHWQEAIESHQGIQKRFPHRAFLHSRGAGGLAILSRYPIQKDQATHEGVGGWFPAWNVEVKAPLGAVQILNVHLRPPISDGGSWVWGYLTSEGIHEKEMKAFRTILAPKIPTIIVGDFNEEPGGDTLDMVRSWGYVNALEEFNPGVRTWHWPTSMWTFEGTLDHIWYEESAFHAVDAHVLDVGRSDHFPVVTTLVQHAVP